MKYVGFILVLALILIGMYSFTPRDISSIDIHAGPLPFQMEIMCHARFPLQNCNIIKKCNSDRVPERVTVAWNKWRDIDFIGTIASESMWDENARGDKGLSIGFCQIHRFYQKENYYHYKSLTTWQDKLDFCYKIYSTYKKQGKLENRLYGYNVRHVGLKKLNIKC